MCTPKVYSGVLSPGDPPLFRPDGRRGGGLAAHGVWRTLVRNAYAKIYQTLEEDTNDSASLERMCPFFIVSNAA